jgi:hypothetical protein
MSDDEFAQFASEARGLDGYEVAEMARAQEYEQLQKESLKEQAQEAIRSFTGGGQ